MIEDRTCKICGCVIRYEPNWAILRDSHPTKEECIRAMKAERDSLQRQLDELKPKKERFVLIRDFVKGMLSTDGTAKISVMDLLADCNQLLQAYDEAKEIAILNEFHTWLDKWG